MLLVFCAVMLKNSGALMIALNHFTLSESKASLPRWLFREMQAAGEPRHLDTGESLLVVS